MYIYQYPYPIILSVSGLDSPRYLNARLSNDIRALRTDNFLLAAALTPQGKAQAFFEVIKFKDEFILFSEGGNLDFVSSAIKQYIVADRVTVSSLNDSYSAFHLACDNLSILESSLGLSLDPRLHSYSVHKDMLILSIPKIKTFGFDFLIPKDALATISKLQEARTLSLEEYSFLRMKLGNLSYPEEINETLLFSEAEIDNSISYKKGCYIGQETLERLDSRGKLPGKILTIKFEGLQQILPGLEVYSGAEQNLKVGTILSASQSIEENETLCYARIKTTATVMDCVMVSGLIGKLFARSSLR